MDTIRPVTKMLLESGWIPAEMVSQLVSWKLLPETVMERLASCPISSEDARDKVARFLDQLEGTIESERAVLRETLFTYGHYTNVLFNNEDDVVRVLIDGLGRVVLPAVFSPLPTTIRLGGESSERAVINADPIYRGTETVAWLLTLGEQGADR